MILTHRKFYFNLNEERRLLRESQESKSQSAAKKLVMQRLGYDEQQADEFVRMKLRKDFLSLRNSGPAKFTLAVTRMYLDNQLTDTYTKHRLNTALEYAANDKHYNEFDRNLNGISAQQLLKMLQPEIDVDLQNRQNEVNNTEYIQNKNYDIVRIDSFEQAQQYGQYTSWCITHNEEMWNEYTDYGINQFYFCLRKGFENVPAQEGESCPLDDYGLSMIAVSVNPMGRLNTCTCRWNHENGGKDKVMDEKQISQVIGRNFYSTFKPNEQGAKIRQLGLMVQKEMQLSNEETRNLELTAKRDGAYDVSLNGKKNRINKEGKLLFNQWFDGIYPKSNGEYTVRLKGKNNIANKEGKLLFNQWFDYIEPNNDGTYTVRVNKANNSFTSYIIDKHRRIKR